MKKRKNKLVVGKKAKLVKVLVAKKQTIKSAVKKNLVPPKPRNHKTLKRISVKKDYRQLILAPFSKHIKKPFILSIERAREYIILFFEYIRLKSIHTVAKMQYDIGNEKLELVKKQTRNEVGGKMVEEFEKMSRETEKQTKPMPRKALLLRVFMYKRIKINLFRLFHPTRLLRNSRKTKTMACTDGWIEAKEKQ